MQSKCLFTFLIFILFTDSVHLSSSSHLYYPLNPRSLPFNRHVRPANCDQIIDQPVQWLLSVNYPSPYDEQLHCLYTVNKFSIDVCKVELTFPEFNLEYSIDCLNDYLLLNNGIRLCGVLAPDTKYILEFPSQSNQLELNFVSNHNINKNGFVAIFNQLNNSCDSTIRQYSGRAAGTIDYPSRSEIYQNTLSVLNREQVMTSSDCNRKFYSFEGKLKSPNFPSFYPTDRLCRYLFKRSSDNVCKIRFKIKTFDLNNYPSKHDKINCDNGDYLEIVNSQNRLCGYKIQEEFIVDYRANSNYLPLYFYSDSIGVSTGFEIDFEQLTNSCTGKDPLITTKCDLKLKDENRLTSPNYPQFYEPNSLCAYEIEPLNSTFCGFTLLFRHLNLELSVDQLGRCNKDYLEMPNGERICGTSKPLEKLFPFDGERRQYLLFVSDGQTENSGFDIQINQIACQALINKSTRINSKVSTGFNRYFDTHAHAAPTVRCDQLITGKHQIMVSPNYPHRYPQSILCQYSIYKFSENVCQVRIQVLDFDLETSNQCQNDYLTIMNTNERYCGKELHLATKVIDFHNADAIRLRFISDSNQYAGVGFKISIEQLENSCRNSRTFGYFSTNSVQASPQSTSYLKVCGVFNEEQFNIESSNYPLTYPENVNCLYRVCKANRNVHGLDIYFNDFSVGTLENNFCSNDYLEINGERYCGHLKNQRLLINFPPNVNIINIRFRTDERDNHLGFKLIIKQISALNQTSIIGSNFNILGLNSSSLNGHPADGYPGYGALNSPNYPGYIDNANSFKNLNSNNRNDLYYYNQNLITQFSSANDINCLPKFFNQKNFYLTSPGYRNRNYPCSMQCNYWIKKTNPNVCAIQLKFDEFRIETSPQCSKDNLQIKNLKFCGTIPMETKKTLEFSENQLVITFKTDPTNTDIGFHITIEQIEC